MLFTYNMDYSILYWCVIYLLVLLKAHFTLEHRLILLTKCVYLWHWQLTVLPCGYN